MGRAHDSTRKDNDMQSTPFFGHMPDDTYRATQRDGFIGGSALGSLLGGSALHLVARRGVAPTAPMLFGTAAHAAILEPAEFGKRYRRAAEAFKVGVDYNKDDAGQWHAVAEDGKRGPFDKSTDARAAAGCWRVTGRDDWFRTRKDAEAACVDDGDSRERLTGSEMDRLSCMRAAVESHAVAHDLVAGPGVLVERAMIWNDPTSGVGCSGKADAYNPTTRTLVDLKTHGKPNPPPQAGGWIARSWIHVQMAHYSAGIRAAGVDVDRVAIVSVETVAPYAVAVYMLSPRMLAVGEHERQRALALWRHADLELPAYGNEPHDVDLPHWAIPPDFDVDVFDTWANEAAAADLVARIAAHEADRAESMAAAQDALSRNDTRAAIEAITDADLLATTIAELKR